MINTPGYYLLNWSKLNLGLVVEEKPFVRQYEATSGLATPVTRILEMTHLKLSTGVLHARNEGEDERCSRFIFESG